jgi:hypothetical protein
MGLFERTKTFHALDRRATVIGNSLPGDVVKISLHYSNCHCHLCMILYIVQFKCNTSNDDYIQCYFAKTKLLPCSCCPRQLTCILNFYVLSLCEFQLSTCILETAVLRDVTPCSLVDAFSSNILIG